jgi:signal transduction histidine kinase
MMRSLYGKMAAVLLGLLIFLGAIFLLVSVYSTRQYEAEVVQRVNLGLAANLVGQDVLLVNGEVNEAALENVFRTLTVINPNIEVYLLDMEGRVVQHSPAPDPLRREQISVEPIEEFLAEGAKLPIVGDDPRSASAVKVFSVSPIMVEDRYEGYLYVVLESQQYESAVSVFRRSHLLRISLTVVAGALAVALLVGLLLFNLLTRRLRRLTDSVEAFRDSDFSDEAVIRTGLTDGDDDEIGRLAKTFERMAERIILQVRKLRQTDELRRELVANVSHDLRTPLSSLKGYIETLELKDDQLTREERMRYLSIARRQSDKLGHQVEELFELARLESAEMKPELESFPIAELIQDVVQEFRLAAEQREVDLDLSLPEDGPLVSADIGLIQRVLQNLIQNAINHTEEGGSVTVVLSAEPRRVTVRVEDTGCGIPRDELVQVFDRFYQAEPSDGSGRRTGGLGLAIVKRILELHGSAVEAASTVGEGTVFKFSLPVSS